MNNDDERDSAEEAFNRLLLHDGASPVVPELIRLAEDLSVVRDFGAHESARCENRDFLVSYYRGRRDLADEVLVASIFGSFARVEALIEVARGRGLLG